MDPIASQTKDKMQKAYDVMLQDFSTVRTGRANPALVENIVINAYGGTERLKVMELATISIQDQTIVITPYDQSIMGEIQKGISDANVGLSPVVSSNIIRINLPPLTEERRKELIKVVSQKAESGKVMMRQIRHEAMDEIKKKEGEVSEDEVERLEKEVQRLTDDFIEKIETLKKEKEEELMRL